MSQGDDQDPFDLDPYGGSPYEPSRAFAYVAVKQARELVEDAKKAYAEAIAANPLYENAVAKSARKSANVQLGAIEGLFYAIEEAEALSRRSDPNAPEPQEAADLAVQGLNQLVPMTADFGVTLTAIGTPDQPPAASPPMPLPPIEDPQRVSKQLGADLQNWLAARRGVDSGDLLVMKVTPGVGKTHAILDAAVNEQQNRQRVVLSVRTKGMLKGDNPEIVDRLHKRGPIRRISLVVITGRGEDNCFEWKTVKAVMEHGYSPGQAVCLHCDNYPTNATTGGLPICEYYESRIRAHNLAQGARRGQHKEYPIVLTTHASYMAADQAGSGRWGSFWGADVAFFDEDPTEAMEADVPLSEPQTTYRSQDPDNVAASAASQILARAIKMATDERKTVAGLDFCGPGSDQSNSHPIHSSYTSAYRGEDLHRLLLESTAYLRRTVGMPSLEQVLRDVAEGQSFSVQPGELASVTSVADLNLLDIPPRALRTIADEVHREISHAMQLRRIAYQKVRGKPPEGMTLEEISQTLVSETDVDPLPYAVRLECLPMDIDKGRKHDEWRFVARIKNELQGRNARLVVGDAYAQKAHYEQLFRRKTDFIDRIGALHPDTVIFRYLDQMCNIGSLRKGNLGRVLNFVEMALPADEAVGKRMLVYGHNDLRGQVEPWLSEVQEKYCLSEVAYEHWWGGRGKDEYNGWEYTFCISDPVQSLSGIEHVVNARAFRDSVRAKTDDEKLEHGVQINVGRPTAGVVQALGSGHPRLVLEHQRQNVAELTQAIHRARPVHQGVRIGMFGEMELGADLVAQVQTFVPADYRKVRVSKAQRSRMVTGFVDSFVSRHEVESAIEAIVDHYGVFSPMFAHALITLANDGIDGIDSAIKMTTRRLLINEPIAPRRHPTEPLSDTVLDANFQLAPTPADRRSVLHRVWHPATYWSTLAPRELPRAIRLAIQALDERDDLAKTTAYRHASWRKGYRGHYPNVYFRPSLSPSEALDLFFEIADNQYGVVNDGKLVRPNAVLEMPRTPWKSIPF